MVSNNAVVVKQTTGGICKPSDETAQFVVINDEESERRVDMPKCELSWV